MLKPTKRMVVGTVALLAPLTVGFGLTAAATVSDGGEGSDHTHDEWIWDDYEIDREYDGALTVVVTDPDGNVVAPSDYDDLPTGVGDLVDEVSDPDWMPPELVGEDSKWNVVDGVPCHQLELGPDSMVSADNDQGTFGAATGPDGEFTAGPVYFAPDVTGTHIDDHLVLEQALLDGTVMDLEGAEPIDRC